MKKKFLLIIGIVIVALSAGGVIWYIATHQAGAALNSISTEQARALPKDTACLSNNSTTKTTVESLPGLGEDGGLWTGQIYDVPAGTNVDVNIATYANTDTITGSLVYPQQYGSYNFTVTKQSDGSDGWRFTEFTGCR